MASFASDADVYDRLGQLLVDRLADPATLAQLRRADAVVQYAFRDPQATITVDVREGHEPTLDKGATELTPELVLSMDADVGAQLFSGELNPMIALARGDVRTKGPVAKLLKLVPTVAGAPHVPEADVEPSPAAAEGEAAHEAPGEEIPSGQAEPGEDAEAPSG